MFPLRESSRLALTVLAAVLIATQLVYFSISYLTHVTAVQMESSEQVQNVLEDEIIFDQIMLKDQWELFTYDIPITNEKLNQLALKYKAEPEYLDFIVEVEKMFHLEPCELLALIAAESGFKPQTRMDGGSLSYSTTQMKMPTAKTAYMAITQYYQINIPYPTHENMSQDKYYAAFLAGGYLRYLHDTYQDKFESYTAYNWGIGGRMLYYHKNGDFNSPYALKVANLSQSFQSYVGYDYYIPTKDDYIDKLGAIRSAMS